MKYSLKQSGFRPWLGDPECITLRRSEVMASSRRSGATRTSSRRPTPLLSCPYKNRNQEHLVTKINPNSQRRGSVLQSDGVKQPQPDVSRREKLWWCFCSAGPAAASSSPTPRSRNVAQRHSFPSKGGWRSGGQQTEDRRRGGGASSLQTKTQNHKISSAQQNSRRRHGNKGGAGRAGGDTIVNWLMQTWFTSPW